MTKTKIGIIGAMHVEVASLKDQMQLSTRATYAGMEFYEGLLRQKPVVIVKCGIGKVNAALCVQILVDKFQVTHVINTGVAGSLDNKINIGDIVVSVSAQYHDVDATVFGYQPGEIPQEGVIAFPADEELRRHAVEAVRKTTPEVKVFEGKNLSGDQFISSHAKKEQLMRDFDGICCEMEGTAIAQASFANHIPFVIIRAISDKADESVSESYDVFEGNAAIHCARIVAYLVQHF